MKILIPLAIIGTLVLGYIAIPPKVFTIKGAEAMLDEPINTISLKITCFTGYECKTPICNSGVIKDGEMAVNPKWKIKELVFEGRTYIGKWISDKYTDIDIWFGYTHEDYLRCLKFGVKYIQYEQ